MPSVCSGSELAEELEELEELDEEELDELRKALDKAGLPKEVRKEADKQLRRLSGMHADCAGIWIANA